MNLRLFSRRAKFIDTSHQKTTGTTSTKSNLPQDLTKFKGKYWRVGILPVGIIGFLAILQMTRDHELRIGHNMNNNPHSEELYSKEVLTFLFST
ncbi:hypothetical protein I4U23_012305 [Adineta vaga]|nr:hypothetical protein I4U23_012305 [Adineta vaga]